MKKISLIAIGFWLLAAGFASAQTEVTTSEAKSLIKNTSKKRTSIHDPSVVYEPSTQRYYIFGSHKAGAYTTDMQNWTQANPTWKAGSSTNATNATAFVTPAVKKVMKGGTEVDLPQFNAMEWSARTDSEYDINGNMWAPDVIWNPTMQKWCMYLSINGNSWHSSIILLTANNITGPYEYQGPVVICGFQDNGHSYKDTDLELVIGTQSSLPARYNVGSKWGNRWPHTIDPAVFYDEEGKLWMVYGSWSGGIWMLELNEETGLRDYDVTYPSTNGSTDGVTSDPYFGTKVAGGYYVSGEGPYIEHIGNYYFLFVSYGGFAPDGGYEMRVFRSDKPNGPYKDASSRSAIFDKFVKNFGAGTDTRGEKIMGSYNNWGFMTVGECAQGHNSIIAAEDGRTYLIYHTKFNDGTIGHQVRVHQVFLNKNGWLVAAPFEYNGEQLTDADISTSSSITSQQIPGTYHLLIHKYKMDHENMEEVSPVDIVLNEDGTVSGKYTGTWNVAEGTGYLTLKLGTTIYNGVIYEEQIDQKTIQTIAFSAMANSGVNVWGYKYHPKYAVAWQVSNQKVPVSNNQQIVKNIDLYAMDLGDDNVTMQWTSNNPDIISDYGRYNPTGLTDDTPVELTARVASCDYYWSETYNVKALSEENAQAKTDWQANLKAFYGFNDGDLSNTLNPSEKAQLLRHSTTSAPQLEDGDPLRNGGLVHLFFGANGKESYVSIPNPLFGQTLDQGATISFWVKPTSENVWDALFGFRNGSERFFLTANLYAGYNDGKMTDVGNQIYNNWVDINHPETVTNSNIVVGRWNLVTIVITPSATSTMGGITMYVNGSMKRNDRFNGSLNGKTFTTKQAFDYQLILNLLSNCSELYLGNGSFWGSADARYDDVMVFDRELELSDITAMNQTINRVFDPQSLTQGIEDIYDLRFFDLRFGSKVFDLNGRIQFPSSLLVPPSSTKRVLISNGKKHITR